MLLTILLLDAGLIGFSACSFATPRFGIGGRYNEGRDEVTKRRAGNLDKAIVALESVVREDPTYRDSLTLLGRAYYKKERYQDGYLILQRALALNKEDEIAWLVLGLSQVRLGDGQKGLESIKGGITLLSRAMRDGRYRDFSQWDRNGLVRSSLRQAVSMATKKLNERENLIKAAELLLDQIDDEERFQRGDRTIQQLQER